MEFMVINKILYLYIIMTVITFFFIKYNWKDIYNNWWKKILKLILIIILTINLASKCVVI